MSLPPGPRSKIPGSTAWTIRRRGMLAYLTGLAAEYGDFSFFRLAGMPFCLTVDPETIRRVVVTDAAKMVKSHTLRGVKKALGDGLLTADGDLHKQQRKLIGPVFHAAAVKRYAEDFVTQATRLADRWQDGQSIDAGGAMTELTLRVVTKSLFDTELDADVGPIGRDMATLVNMFERIRNPLAFILDKLPFLPSNRRYFAALGRLDDRIRGMIRERRDDGQNGPTDRFDLLTVLLNLGGGMSEQQARDEAVTLFMAGHETTANALIWTWLLLAENPAADRLLHEELDRVLPGGRRATAENYPQLKVTRAVIAESMRLRPPAWTIARMTGEPYAVGPYTVPAGTTILMPQYLVHRDARWWPEPERFDVTRWLGGPDGSGDAVAKDRPKYAYFPFGGGPRSCVGEPFAWLEAVLLLATLAQRWRLERADATPVRLFPTITLRPRDKVKMTVKRRGAAPSPGMAGRGQG